MKWVKGSKKQNKKSGYVHFHCPVPTPTDDFIGNEIDAIYFIGVAWKIRLDFIRLQIPDL